MTPERPVRLPASVSTAETIMGGRQRWPITRSERARSGSRAREDLLKREKEHTRLGDERAQARRDHDVYGHLFPTMHEAGTAAVQAAS
jgi:hypothetical protein